jgi:hypothetical protein
MHNPECVISCIISIYSDIICNGYPSPSLDSTSYEIGHEIIHQSTNKTFLVLTSLASWVATLVCILQRWSVQGNPQAACKISNSLCQGIFVAGLQVKHLLLIPAYQNMLVSKKGWRGVIIGKPLETHLGLGWFCILSFAAPLFFPSLSLIVYCRQATTRSHCVARISSCRLVQSRGHWHPHLLMW